jgi:S1-C subfamily serine protease
MTLFLALAGALALPTFAFANDENEDKRTYLGIRMQRVEGDLADALSIDEDSGVLIGQVVDDSPAAKAGLKEGDVILKVDGQEMGTPEALGELIRSKSVDEKINVQFLRSGKTRTVTVTLADAPENFREERSRTSRRNVPEELEAFEIEEGESGWSHGYLGVMTQPLSEDLGEYFGVRDGEGALVSEVVDSSPAARLGLRAGDVITKLDGNDINGPGDLLRAMRDIEEEKEIEVTWIRDKKVREGSVQVEVRDAARPGREGRRFEGRREFPRRMDRFTPQSPLFRGDSNKMQAELEALRNEIQELRLEMQRMKEDLRRN